MAKLLVGSQWYTQVAPATFYENDFERLILKHADTIYPSFFVVPFKLTVYADQDSSAADLALISKRYGEWWVVEVERADHSLVGHVLPQVRTLAHATYGEKEARYLLEQCPDLDACKVRSLVKGQPPSVLVLVNAPVPEWETALMGIGARLGVVELFRSDRDQFVVRVNGFQPIGEVAESSLCTFDRVLPNLLWVRSPQVLPVGEQEIRVLVAGCETAWTRLESGDKVWLIPKSAVPLDSRRKYRLKRNIDGILVVDSI